MNTTITVRLYVNNYIVRESPWFVTKNEDAELQMKNQMESKAACNDHIPLVKSSQAAVTRVNFRGINIDETELLRVSIRESVHSCF
jgi:hypothetical protein